MESIKIYVAHYNNGESWEDYSHWFSKNAYINKESCRSEILSHGYKFNAVGNVFEYINEEMYDHYYATIDELELY